MTQAPPPYGYNQSLPPQPLKPNPAAIVSLITGILMCVPLMGIIAVITGILGLNKAKDPTVGGRGMAIAGLVLGALGILVMIGEGGVYFGAKRAVSAAMNSPAHAVAKQFVADIAAGDADKAQADCDSSVGADKIATAIEQAKTWGTFKDSTLFATPAGKEENGSEKSMVLGVADFANGQKSVSITVSNPSTTPKVSDFGFGDKPQK